MDRSQTWFVLRPALIGTALAVLALIVAACNNSGGSSGY
jgi:predicted small secreted protein